MKPSRRILRRQWELMLLLNASRTGLSLRKLMAELQCSRASVYRDLGLLKDAGAPIESVEQGGEARYRLFRKEDLPPLGLTALQIAAISLARQELEPLAGTALVAELDTLLAKLRPVERQRTFRFPDVAPGSPVVMRVLDRALEFRRRALIEYRAASRGGRASLVHIEPLVINVAGGVPYVRAYCVERRAERTYKVARIVRAELTAEKASYAPIRTPEVAFERSRKAWIGEPEEVAVRLDAEVSWLAGEYPLMKDQTVERRADGSAVVRAEVAGVVEATRWVLSWGGAAEALEPASLRALCEGELREALGKYEGPGPKKAAPALRAKLDGSLRHRGARG